MKKCLSMLCAVAMLLGLMIPVSATGTHDIKISASNHTVAPGDTLFVQIDISGVDEDDEDFAMNWLSMKISYDDTVFDFGADLNGDGEIADYKSGRNTICETTSRATKTNTPWKTMSPVPAIGMSDADNAVVIPFDAGATPKFNNGKTTATFNSLGAISYTNGALMGFYLTVKDTAISGDYAITLESGVATGRAPLRYTEEGSEDTAIACTFVNGKITVEGGSTPSTPTAKTVTYSATNGKVIASLTELSAGTPVASGTIATEAADSDEVYFYFFPNKGYTATGMTVNGEPVIGADGGRKFTITEDKTFNFEFKAVSGTATASAVTIVEKSADKLTVFGQATGASDFGAIVGNDKFAADGADGDGYFAIELTGTGIFAAGKTYAAKIYAGTVEGAATTFTID